MNLYEKAILNGMDTIRCINSECKNVMVFEAGKVDYGQRDEDGNVLSKIAAEHFAKSRIRCS